MNGMFKKAGVIYIDHYAVTTNSLDRTLKDFLSLPGSRLLKGPGNNKSQNVRFAFVQLMNFGTIEVLSPLNEDSPIINHINNGGGAYHLCYAVEDINKSIEILKNEFSAKVVSEPKPDEAFFGRKVAFLFERNHGLFELCEAYPEILINYEDNDILNTFDTSALPEAKSALMSIFKKIFKDAIKDTDNLSMENIKKWDSLNHLLLIQEVEEKFGIQIHTDKISELKSFNLILNYIGEKNDTVS